MELAVLLNHPDRNKLVWESAAGPVAVESMTLQHLEHAVAFADRTEFESEALPAMRERLRRLRAEE